MMNPFSTLFSYFYLAVQIIITQFFKPKPPKKSGKHPKGRIAVVGSGITGISSAAHAAAHGFEVVIFESNDKVGGIWSHVNSTSALQLHSILYRFHPGVIWSCAFPNRDEILGQVEKLWKEYHLEEKTRFNTQVTSIQRAAKSDYSDNGDPRSRWVINDGADGIFDAVILSIGTLGDPSWTHFDGMPDGFIEKKSHSGQTNGVHGVHGDSRRSSSPTDDDVFSKDIVHSSELDTLDEKVLNGKTVIVVGSGASGVEAVETALQKGAKRCVILARDDKWIIPRNIILDTLLAMQPFGRQMPLSFLWEDFLRRYHYRNLEDLIPAHKGLFEGTPIVNDEFLKHIRKGKCDYVRGDTLRFTREGVLVNKRRRGTKPSDEGKEVEIQGDVIVLATGYKPPSLDFFSKEEKERLFPERYDRPNLYLQTFSTQDWSILMTNSSYKNAIGSVGHFHIGIYTRILLTFLMDKATRPPADDMMLWVDGIKWLKKFTSGTDVGFSFFTYMELTLWFAIFHLFRIRRLRWVFFIMQGWGQQS